MRFAAEWLDKLDQAVDGADAAPTPDARRGFERLAPITAAALRAWDELKAKDLAALNAKLAATKQTPISLTPPERSP